MSILLGLYLLLAIFATIHDVNCVEIKGVNRLNNYFWFIQGQNFTASCTATGVNASCAMFQWTAFFIRSQNHLSVIKPEMLEQTKVNGSVISSTITLLNSTEFSKNLWYIKCLLKNTTSGCIPNIAADVKSKTATVLPFHAEDLPKAYVASQYISVDYGQDINLTCTANVYLYLDGITVNILWLKDDILVAQEHKTGSLDNFPFTLSLRNISDSSSGHYVCSVKVDNIYDSHKFEDNATVFLAVNPRLIGSKTKVQYLVPGQAFQISCEIDGNPSFIKWQKKFGEGNYSNLPNNENIMITDKGRKLRIENFNPVDATYICKVVKDDGDDIVQEFKLIARSEPTLTGPKQKELKVDPDDDVTLTCDIDVLPLNITWTVEGSVIKDNNSRYKISVENRRLLLIRHIDFSDSRSFVCAAKNGLNIEGVQQEIIVYVKAAKDPLSVLWPVFGILIVAILVTIIIGAAIYIKRKRKRELERQEEKELKDTNLTPSQSGYYGDHDGVDDFDAEPQRLLQA